MAILFFPGDAIVSAVSSIRTARHEGRLWSLLLGQRPLYRPCYTPARRSCTACQYLRIKRPLEILHSWPTSSKMNL